MNYTQEELKELVAINAITDQELGGTRLITPAEGQVFARAAEELFEQGFVISKDNVLKLHRAFDNSPQVPMTRETILETTKVHRSHFAWKSEAEIKYQKLSGQLGQQKTDAIWSYFPAYHLKNTYPTFNALASFFLTRNVDAGSFQNAFGNVQAGVQGWSGNIKVQGRPGHRLEFETDTRPTLSSAHKRLEIEAKTPTTPTRKTPEQIAADRDDAVSHIRTLNPLDPYGRDYYKPYKSSAHAQAKPVASTSTTEQDPTQAYFENRTNEFIAAIPSRNDQVLAKAFIQEKQQEGMSWSRIHTNLENFYNRLKTDRWPSQQRG